MTDGETAVRNDGGYQYRDDELTATITAALAETADVDPLELPPLYDSIDADALDRLCRTNGSTTVTVRFTHAGHVVQVDSDGSVTIRSGD